MTWSVPAETPVHNDIRQGFVDERVPHITFKSIADNTLIDDIWQKCQAVLEPLRAAVNAALGKTYEEWQIPRDLAASAAASAKQPHAKWWEAHIAWQKEIDASIAARAHVANLYDRPYPDGGRVRVAGPFKVESLSPRRVRPASEEELVDVIDYLKTEGMKQEEKGDRISFESLTPLPGNFVGANGTLTRARTVPNAGRVLISPEYGTVGRQDLVAAARRRWTTASTS